MYVDGEKSDYLGKGRRCSKPIAYKENREEGLQVLTPSPLHVVLRVNNILHEISTRILNGKTDGRTKKVLLVDVNSRRKSGM